MNLTIRYFASLREALGERQELRGVPSPLTVAHLRALLSESSLAHAQALQPSKAVRCAVNQVMAGDEASVPDGAEVAFFPPVTGG